MQTKSLIKIKENDFLVNPEYTQERTGNYELQKVIQDKWVYTTKTVLGCGNIHSLFFFDIQKNSFVFSNDYNFDEKERLIHLYKTMSPALLLYRLIATFFGAPVCFDGYKMIWTYTVEHKKSGKAIQFSEWKGAIGFWLPEHSHKELTPEFKTDLIKLMNYIISTECAHPYDNLVAGSVA